MGFGYIRCFKTIRRKPKITDTETTVVFLQADGIHPQWNRRFHMGSSACFYDKIKKEGDYMYLFFVLQKNN